MKYRVLIFLLLSIFFLTCNKAVKKEFLQTIEVSPASYEVQRNGCGNQANYIPDLDHLDHTPVKYVRVNYHIMRNGQGKGNFDKTMGRKYINLIHKTANGKLRSNKKMNLPPGNNTAVLPMLYQYVLTGMPDDPNDDGIYFHDDDDLYALIGHGKRRNNYNKDVYEKYGVQKGSVLNVFVMTHHVDSLKAKNYPKDSKGIGFPNFVKVTNWYEPIKNSKWVDGQPKSNKGKWYAVRLLNHEIGHSLGLRHTWRGNDGCDDTPNHTNCWNKTKGKKPCDVYWSNNFMDYNAHSSAWSPCQIGTVHRNFSGKKKSSRKLLIRTWCDLKDQPIRINKDFNWAGAKDLEGHLIIENGASLTVSCRLSLPKGGRIIVKPNAKLILNGATLENDCGDKWKGIEVWSDKSGKGMVESYNGTQILNVENEVIFKEAQP